MIPDLSITLQIFNVSWEDKEFENYVIETGIAVREYKMCDDGFKSEAATNMRQFEKVSLSSESFILVHFEFSLIWYDLAHNLAHNYASLSTDLSGLVADGLRVRGGDRGGVAAHIRQRLDAGGQETEGGDATTSKTE